MSLEETRRLLSPCSIDSEDASHYAVDDLKFALEHGDSKGPRGQVPVSRNN